MWMIRKPRTIALALQGGGAHGAFASGVLDRLLETGFAPDRVAGVSSGALLGTMLAQGWAAGGAGGARTAIDRLWERVAQAQAVSPVQNGPLERFLWGPDLSRNPVWQGLETAMRFFSPAQLNPLGHNPLRAVIADLLLPDLLASPAALRLTVGATDVETGEAVLFGNREITVDVLLASACLPFVFPAVEIGGQRLLGRRLFGQSAARAAPAARAAGRAGADPRPAAAPARRSKEPRGDIQPCERDRLPGRARAGARRPAFERAREQLRRGRGAGGTADLLEALRRGRISPRAS